LLPFPKHSLCALISIGWGHHCSELFLPFIVYSRYARDIRITLNVLYAGQLQQSRTQLTQRFSNKKHTEAQKHRSTWELTLSLQHMTY